MDNDDSEMIDNNYYDQQPQLQNYQQQLPKLNLLNQKRLLNKENKINEITKQGEGM